MTIKKYKTTLVQDGDSNWHFIFFPSSLLGTRARTRVKGKINGHLFATSALSWRDEQHVITVNSDMRRQMNLQGGDAITLELEPDSAPPKLPVPKDFIRAMNQAKGTQIIFKKLAPSHRKYYIQWITEAKTPETRTRRIERAIAMIAAGTDPFHPKERPKSKK